MVRPANAFHSSLFQGGAEHNVPVVISKIFKDQVGKKEMPFSLWFKCGNSENLKSVIVELKTSIESFLLSTFFFLMRSRDLAAD